MLEWVISSAVLTALIIALRFILKGKISLRLQYALWALVMVRLLVPVSFGATGMSVMNVVPEDSAAVLLSPVMSAGVPDGAFTLPADAAVPADQGYSAAPDGETVQVNEGSVTGVVRNVTDWSNVLKIVWLTGTAVMALWLLISNLRFSARLHRSRHTLVVDSCALPVYVSEIIDTPCLFGLFRPCIYVTPAVADSEKILRHSIEHELTHYRHGDHIWSLLRGACLALHWFNPLVWWAAILSRNDAELACDEATIKRIGESERAEYGRTLIEMTCQKRPALLLTATTMTGGKSGIKERVALLARKPKTAVYTLVAVLLIAAVAVGCTFTGANTDTPWAWAQSIDTNDASVYIWYSTNNEKQLTDTEKETLVSMLNSLKQGNFTQNKELAGITPDYGLRITTDGAEYYINEADTQSGSFEMNYDGKQWWIGSDELHSFISALAESDEQALPPKTENGETPFPTVAIDALFASGDIALTLNLAGDGAYNSYLADEWYSGRFNVLLDGYKWTELEMPLTEPSDFWLTAISADGAKSMTFWANSGAGMVQYNDGNTTTYWSASPANEYNKSIAEDIRFEYDNLDVDYSRISFYLDGSAEEAADFFVHNAYGSHMMSLAPGNMYGMSDYDVAQWEVREVSENGDAVVGWLECAFTPWNSNSSGIWAGNTAEGTGAYEGKLTFYREFVLQRQTDGYWHCIGLGTGGYSLPE